jgi:imidazolonepropionase
MTSGASSPRPSQPAGDLLVRDARVVTPTSDPWRYLRGAESGNLRVLQDTDVRIRDGQIVEVGRGLEGEAAGVPVLEAGGRVLLPGFVDAHTHACWAGDRLEEWAARMAGASYQELLEAGGGILSTVTAVRAASVGSLSEALLARLNQALAHGTTTMEVKSGYGLDTETELKMLRAIQRAGARWPGSLVPTACIGHARDPNVPEFVTQVIEETLPAVNREFPGIAVDAYCEVGAWSVEESLRLFRAALALGHPVRVHADQFTSMGMVEAAVELGAHSVDHLEASSPETLAALGMGTRQGAGARPEGGGDSPSRGPAGVLLPVSGFHLDDRYADGRALVDAGGAVVVATNWNPGSAPSPSIPFAAALAVRKNGLAPGEALTAVTHNAAVLLGFPDRGRIEEGARGDLVLLDAWDERELTHTVGARIIHATVCGGHVVQAT